MHATVIMRAFRLLCAHITYTSEMKSVPPINCSMFVRAPFKRKHYIDFICIYRFFVKYLRFVIQTPHNVLVCIVPLFYACACFFYYIFGKKFALCMRFFAEFSLIQIVCSEIFVFPLWVWRKSTGENDNGV